MISGRKNTSLILSIFFIFALFQTSSFAAEKLISQIQIQGQKRIEKDAILGKIKSKTGESVREERIREDILQLFKTGYFSDIQVHRDETEQGILLTYQVVEKPSIGELVFEGQSELKEDELKDASGMKPFEIFNQAKVNEAVEKLQKFAEDKGYFLARIEAKVEEIQKGESMRVRFVIDENEKVKVRKITFLGVQKVKEGSLKDYMQTKEMGYFTALSQSGSFKQESFERDLLIIEKYYKVQGYLRAKVDRPQIYVTPDKRSIFITIHVEEGERYKVGDIDFSGDLLDFSKEELFGLLKLPKEDFFNVETLQKDILALQAKYGDLGYAFANPIPQIQIDDKALTASIRFEMDKGFKVYFGRINVVGNTQTRDKVVRRELKITEGELFNFTRKKQSEENVQRLGFFETVNFRTSTAPEKQDLMNVDIVVKERPTGSLTAGAGYNSTSEVTFQLNVNQSNFSGRGQNLGVSIDYNKDRQSYTFSFFEPYLFDSVWSGGTSIYQENMNAQDYSEVRTGSRWSLGHPLAEFIRLTSIYKYENNRLRAYASNGSTTTDQTIFNLDSVSGVTSSLAMMVEYDDRNDRMSPSKGWNARASMEYAGLGGDFHYLRSMNYLRYYKNLFWDVVLRTNFNFDAITKADDRDIPFNQLFLLGGQNTLRGYKNRSIGLRKFSQYQYDQQLNLTPGINLSLNEKNSWRPYGNLQQAYANIETEFPLIKEAGIKGVFFYDVGTAADAVLDGDLYSNLGLGFRWGSPIGPLRFEWGFPLKKDRFVDENYQFNFSIWQPF